MQSETYDEISKQIDEAIFVASNNVGCNIQEIRQKNYIKEYYSPIFIGILPFISSFVVMLFLRSEFSFSEGKMLFIAIAVFSSFSFFSFFAITFRQNFLNQRTEEILKTKVGIPYFVIDPIYLKIESFIDIERKYDLNIRELDQLRNFFYEKLFLATKDYRIGFLNPKNK